MAMTTIRRPLLAALLLLSSCIATQSESSSHGSSRVGSTEATPNEPENHRAVDTADSDDVHAASAPATTVADPAKSTQLAEDEAPASTSDAAAVGRNGARILEHIDSLLEQGKRAAATEAFLGWMAPGLVVRGRGLPKDQFADLLLGASVIAEELAMPEEQRAICELWIECLEFVVTEEHPAMHSARLRLSRALWSLGDREGALVLAERVYQVQRRTLAPDDPELLITTGNLGVKRSQLSDFEGALELQEQVYAIRSELHPPGHPDLVLSMSNLAFYRTNLGDHEGAMELRRQLHDAQVELHSDLHPSVAVYKWRLSEAYEALGNLTNACELMEGAHTILSSQLASGDFNLLEAKRRLMELRRAMGDPWGALELNEDFYAAFERLLPEEAPSRLEQAMLLAAHHHEQDNSTRARELLEYVCEVIAHQVSDDDAILNATRGALAVVRREVGDLQGALVLHEKVIAVIEGTQPVNERLLLEEKQGLGSTLSAMGEHERALEIQIDVLAGYERILDDGDRRLLEAKLHLALRRARVGDLVEALALAEDVRAVHDRNLAVADPQSLQSLRVLGGVLAALGDEAGARDLAEHAHQVCEEQLSAGHFVLAKAKAELAFRRLKVGDLDGARSLYEWLHDYWASRLPEEHVEVMNSKLGLAMVCKLRGDYAGAIELEQRVHAVLLGQFPSGHQRVWDSAFRIGSSYFGLGNFDAARDFALESIAGLEQVHPPGSGMLTAPTMLLANVYRLGGNDQRLRECLASILEYQVAYTRVAYTQAPRVARASAARRLGILGWLTDVGSLLATDDSGMRRRLFESVEGWRCVSTPSHAVARLLRDEPELDQLLASLAVVRRRIADVSAAVPKAEEGPDAWRSELRSLGAERDRIDRQARASLEGLGWKFDAPRAFDLASTLPGDAAIVTFWLRRRPGAVIGEPHGPRETYLAFVLTPDAKVQMIDIGSAAEVDAVVAGWRAAVGQAVLNRGGFEDLVLDPIEAGPDELGRRVREVVLDPILEAAPGACELRIVLDGSLHLLPLDVLPLGDGVVADSYQMHFGSNVHQLTESHIESVGVTHLLAVGGVDYADSTTGIDMSDEAAERVGRRVPAARSNQQEFPALPGGAQEVLDVMGSFEAAFGREGRMLTGSTATKGRLADAADGVTHLHIATHGWFVSESEALSVYDELKGGGLVSWESLAEASRTVAGFFPETLCGLALAGANHGSEGLLTAEELQTLDLTSCELAVLSACETNVGIRRAGQGIQSLQSALHAAGARTAITSLWKVDDDATRQLFEVFYAALWQEGLRPADALWRAKSVLREEGRPLRDWAGWMLTGAAE